MASSNPYGPTIATTPTIGNVTVGATSTLVIAENKSAKHRIFINDSAIVVYLAIGEAAVMNKGIRLNASGGSYEMFIAEGSIYNTNVYGICASSANVCTFEGV